MLSLKHKTGVSATPPPVGPFLIVITAITRDTATVADPENPDWYSGESARDEQERPEPVIGTIRLRPGIDQAHAVERAAAVARYLGQRELEQYRVKVVGGVA